MKMNEMDEIDRVIAREDEIVPSSGFTLSVMDAVRAEAEVPRAIEFPWLRALPVIAALGVVIAMLIAGMVELVRFGMTTPMSAASWVLLPSPETWIVTALLLTAVATYVPLHYALKK